jgi:hypothetical protein
MITSYALHGDFIESCDCFDLCPCWVDDDPDEDHCTGLVMWKLGEGSTIGSESGSLDVSGAVVAAVTGHSGGRRTASALTVLYVDVKGCGGEKHFDVLSDAFTGTEATTNGARERIAGPLGALARVTGTVLSPAQPADIDFPSTSAATWSLAVRPYVDGKPGTEAAVRAQGEPRRFPDDPEDPPGGRRSPLKLAGTALHAELQIQDTADAQETSALSVRVPALPGGYLEVQARSGMRGAFAYSHPKNQQPRRASKKASRQSAGTVQA